MPRLLRDAPLNGDLGGLGQRDLARRAARAARASPRACPRSSPSASAARGADRRLDAHLDALAGALADLAGADAQWRARRAVEDLALAFQASLLVRHAPPAVADAFCAGRLGDGARPRLGTLPRRDRRRRDRGARAAPPRSADAVELVDDPEHVAAAVEVDREQVRELAAEPLALAARGAAARRAR